MAALNIPPITASSDRSLDPAGTACATVQVDLSDERRSLLMLDLVRALARKAAAKALEQAGLETPPENTP